MRNAVVVVGIGLLLGLLVAGVLALPIAFLAGLVYAVGWASSQFGGASSSLSWPDCVALVAIVAILCLPWRRRGVEP